MKCNRCGVDTVFYYKAGPVVLCENCACNSVAVLSDEGLFPFFDVIIIAQSGDGTATEPASEEPAPAGGSKGFFDYEEDGLPEEKFPEEFPEE